jgi:FkbM family methyltransferase
VLSRSTERVQGKPSWYRWDGGWEEIDGENTRYFEWGLGPSDCVLDIGTYEGRWIIEIVRRYGCKGFAFEPATRAIKLAKERAAEANVDIVFQPYALGAEKRQSTLYDCERDGGSLVYPEVKNPFHEEGYDEESVTVLDIKNVLYQWGIKPWALMSLNTEGGEYEILPRLIETNYITWFDRMMIQWHQWTTEYHNKMIDIQGQIARTHEMEWNHGAWETWRRKSNQPIQPL